MLWFCHTKKYSFHSTVLGETKTWKPKESTRNWTLYRLFHCFFFITVHVLKVLEVLYVLSWSTEFKIKVTDHVWCTIFREKIIRNKRHKRVTKTSTPLTIKPDFIQSYQSKSFFFAMLSVRQTLLLSPQNQQSQIFYNLSVQGDPFWSENYPK